MSVVNIRSQASRKTEISGMLIDAFDKAGPESNLGLSFARAICALISPEQLDLLKLMTSEGPSKVEREEHAKELIDLGLLCEVSGANGIILVAATSIGLSIYKAAN